MAARMNALGRIGPVAVPGVMEFALENPAGTPWASNAINAALEADGRAPPVLHGGSAAMMRDARAWLEKQTDILERTAELAAEIAAGGH